MSDTLSRGQFFLTMPTLPVTDRAVATLRRIYENLLCHMRQSVDEEHQDINADFVDTESIVAGHARTYFEKIGVPYPIIQGSLRLDFKADCIAERGRYIANFKVLSHEIHRGQYMSIKVQPVKIGEAIVDEIHCWFMHEPQWFIHAKILTDTYLSYGTWDAKLESAAAGTKRRYNSFPDLDPNMCRKGYFKLMLPFWSYITDANVALLKEEFEELAAFLIKQFGQDMVTVNFSSRETYVSGDKSKYLEMFGLPSDAEGQAVAVWDPNMPFDDGWGPATYGDGVNSTIKTVLVARGSTLDLVLSNRSIPILRRYWSDPNPTCTHPKCEGKHCREWTGYVLREDQTYAMRTVRLNSIHPLTNPA